MVTTLDEVLEKLLFFSLPFSDNLIQDCTEVVVLDDVFLV
jgi:hypothetical protein